MPKIKLTVELVPKHVISQNVRDNIKPSEWTIRFMSYEKANKCEICKSTGLYKVINNVECHEIWEHKDVTLHPEIS
jgi:hypothetical protein